MTVRTTLAAGIACLIAAQVVAAFAWPQRPAAATSEYLAADENLGEVFVEMEPGEFAGTLMLGGLRGLVTDLPVQSFDTDSRGVALKISTDFALTETQEIGLSDAGLIPLMKCKDTDYSAFYSNQSVQHYRTHNSAAARVNARLSSMLQYVLCVSRFAHYVKIIGRDKVGSFATPEDCQAHLQSWLREYTDASPGASDS